MKPSSKVLAKDLHNEEHGPEVKAQFRDGVLDEWRRTKRAHLV